MKKILIVALCLAAFAGCSTIPALKNPDDSLMVMKVNRIFMDNQNKVMEKPKDFMPLHVFHMAFDNDPTLYVIQLEYEQLIISNLKPGPHRITSIHSRFASSSAGDEGVIPVNIPFVLKPGCINILPFSFNMYIINPQRSGYTWDLQLLKLDTIDREALVDKLSKYPEFKTWELAY